MKVNRVLVALLVVCLAAIPLESFAAEKPVVQAGGAISDCKTKDSIRLY